MRALVASALLLLLFAPFGTATPTVTPVLEGEAPDCRGSGETGREVEEREEWRWQNSSATCDVTYRHQGVKVENDGEEVARAGAFDRSHYSTEQTYDHHDKNDWSTCDWSTCGPSWSYDNSTTESHEHRAQGVDSSLTGPIETDWCDTTTTSRSNDSTAAVSDHTLLLSRDTYHAQSSEQRDSCGKGARTDAAEVALIRCESVHTNEGRYEEHYRPETGVVWDGSGTDAYENVCLLGAWRDVDVAGERIEIRAGYEETRRDCYPACGPTTEEALVARAQVNGQGLDAR